MGGFNNSGVYETINPADYTYGKRLKLVAKDIMELNIKSNTVLLDYATTIIDYKIYNLIVAGSVLGCFIISLANFLESEEPGRIPYRLYLLWN